MLSILWRIGVVSVTIAVPDAPVRPVGYHLNLFAFGLTDRSLLCFALGAMKGTSSTRSLLLGCPATARMRYHVNIALLTHNHILQYREPPRPFTMDGMSFNFSLMS